MELSAEAEQISLTVEVQTLAPCIRAIVADADGSQAAAPHAFGAFETVLAVGNVDSFVAAYRGYPRLLGILAQNPDLRQALTEITERAHDWGLAKDVGLSESGKRPSHAPLSKREKEILGLIAQGLRNNEIANVLFISEATVKVHVRHIFEKLGVRTRTEAALRASAME